MKNHDRNNVMEVHRDIRGELIGSLGVDGDRTETLEFPSPRCFVADDFDEWGTISISWKQTIFSIWTNTFFSLTFAGISANFS